MKVKVIDVKCDVSIEIDVKDELSEISKSYDGNYKVVENIQKSNENKPQSYEMSRKCDSSKIVVEMTEDLVGNNNKSVTFEDANETDETCSNIKLALQLTESYVKIKKMDIQEVAVSHEQEFNNNQSASKDGNSRSTTRNLPTVSLLAKPRSEVQAPLTAFFLPSASSEQTDGPVDSAEPAPSDNGSGSALLAEFVITSKSPGEDMEMQSQPEKRKLAPSTDAPSPLSTFHSRASPARTPAARTFSPSQSRERPGNVPPRLTRCSSRIQETRPAQNSIPVDSSDLPEGWRRFKVPRRRHYTGHQLRIDKYDLYILTSEPRARKLRSQKDVDACIEKKKLNLNIKFRPWLTGNAPRTPLSRIPNPSQPLQVNMSSGSFHPAPSSPASRLLPKIATNPGNIRPVRKLPTLKQPVKTDVTTTPCSPVLPLPTLANALASLGGKEEGSKKLVLFHLTDQQIKAFNTLGVREVGIVE